MASADAVPVTGSGAEGEGVRRDGRVPQGVARRLAEMVGARNVITDPAELLVYECDGLTHGRARPELVVLPGSTEEVAAVVRVAREAGVAARPARRRAPGSPAARGRCPAARCSRSRACAGSSSSISRTAGRGSSPGSSTSTSRARSPPRASTTRPIPSSQSVCSIGGNVAENSGGAHCLKYGFTTNHVLAARVVLSDGSVVDLGGPAADAPGYDLLARARRQRGACSAS